VRLYATRTRRQTATWADKARQRLRHVFVRRLTFAARCGEGGCSDEARHRAVDRSAGPASGPFVQQEDKQIRGDNLTVQPEIRYYVAKKNPVRPSRLVVTCISTRPQHMLQAKPGRNLLGDQADTLDVSLTVATVSDSGENFCRFERANSGRYATSRGVPVPFCGTLGGHNHDRVQKTNAGNPIKAGATRAAASTQVRCPNRYATASTNMARDGQFGWRKHASQ